ncbi:hypothetical protein H6784_02135 [Candidatus Nomurabacteria bacterium]|nr:hypothetical protein [Candidatus Kaiserbacteria bacterium]MCB9814195.1 hypothetical protein [Candidatus Nomurabacteria bacterium]
MKKTELFTSTGHDELSLELKRLLTKAGLKSFSQLSEFTRLGLLELIPELKVRHLVNLELALEIRDLFFQPDNSIQLDLFINQRKLFELWKKGVYTYEQLDKLPFAEFAVAMGGPHSRFFRRRVDAESWAKEHGIAKKLFEILYLTSRTAWLLYAGGITSLEETVIKSDFELAQILQPSFGLNGIKLLPLTRKRLLEIKFALLKAGIHRPCMPL